METKAKLIRAALSLAASAALLTSAGSTPVLTKSPGETQEPKRQQIGEGQESIPEESRWTGREWGVNQEIPVREWWDDMAKRGYIVVDSVALQYVGLEMINLVNGANLIPNPFEYSNTGHEFVGSCISALESLEASSQGHIIISQDAYEQVPGAEKCEVFVNR